jgi:hypothetical protein
MSDKNNYCPTCETTKDTSSLHCPFCGTKLVKNPNQSEEKSGEPLIDDGLDLPEDEEDREPVIDDGLDLPEDEEDREPVKILKEMTLKVTGRNEKINIKDGEILGRNNVGAKIFRENTNISRAHAKITYEDGKWFIEDLDSDNGTYIKGKKIKKAELDLGVSFSITHACELSVVKC